MAAFKGWALLLIVIFAISRSTDCRSVESNANYEDVDFTGDDFNAAKSTPEVGFQDDDPDLQGDEEGDNDDEMVDSPGQRLMTTPQHFVVKQGETVRLPCEISNSSENSAEYVSWRHGDLALAAGTHAQLYKMNNRTQVFKNWTLEIPVVTAKDAGTYVCELASMKESVRHTLNVLSPLIQHAPSIKKMEPENPADRIVKKGSRLEITCIAEGYPKPTLVWTKTDGETKQNQRLTSADGVNFTLNSVLIEKVERRHEGEYFCMAENTIGNPAIRSLGITVVGEPEVHIHKAQVNTALGETAIIECTAHYQTDSITWLKDDVRLQETNDVVITTEYPKSTVRIESVKEKDFGTYKCIAKNSHGVHSRAAELVAEPVLETLRISGDALEWRVESHDTLEDVELQYRRIDGEGSSEWQQVSVKPQATAHRHVHDLLFPLNRLPEGKYEARSRARNTHGWGVNSKSIFFSGAYKDPNPESIQVAGVGANLGSGATNIKAAFTLATTIISCLLISFL